MRTFTDWCDPPPGFVEADLVVHSGPSTRGSYVQTLVLTDVASGWTECAPLLVREQHLLIELLEKLKADLPFALVGIDTDNDTVFINETVKTYCEANRIEFTRCRPYRKNDQAYVMVQLCAGWLAIVALKEWQRRGSWRVCMRRRRGSL